MQLNTRIHVILACTAAMVPLLSLTVAAQVSSETPGWFPFTMSPLDNPVGSPMDMSFLNAGGAGSRITVQDGHFVNDRGERVRFLATNVTFSSCVHQIGVPVVNGGMATRGSASWRRSPYRMAGRRENHANKGDRRTVVSRRRLSLTGIDTGDPGRRGWARDLPSAPQRLCGRTKGSSRPSIHPPPCHRRVMAPMANVGLVLAIGQLAGH